MKFGDGDFWGWRLNTEVRRLRTWRLSAEGWRLSAKSRDRVQGWGGWILSVKGWWQRLETENLEAGFWVLNRPGNLLICSFRSNQMSDCVQFAKIAQDKLATVSKSLRLIKTNERTWANRSGRSWQMSNHEWFAQVAHDKWANEQFTQKKFS